MKKHSILAIFTIFMLTALALGSPAQVHAQIGTPTQAPTAIEEQTATPTEEEVFSRPVVVIESFSLSKSPVRPGTSFDLVLNFVNSGGSDATNIIVVFDTATFLPQETGGVGSIPWIPPTGDRSLEQQFWASEDLWGDTVGTIVVHVTYTDSGGASYSENFTLSINIEQPNWVVKPTATPTPMSVIRPQLVIDSYTADVDPLQPGTMFKLQVDVRNLGNANAKGVTMVLGGGSVADNGAGTPQAGVSGSGSDLSTFAPLGSSNLVYLGDLEQGKTLSSTPRLIVNVSANPGAYPFKVSFVYNDEKGVRIVDDQIITLLVYSLPSVECGFYQDAGIFTANMPASLPIQVTNLGRKSAVLGTLKVTADNADITNNTALVGALEPGGYFTLDANYTPFAAGEQVIHLTISYTDDFNQPRVIEQSITIQVEEEMIMPTEEVPLGPDGLPLQPEPVEETLGQKILRFLKGLIGLDSAPPQPESIPTEMENTEKPVVIPGGKG